MRFKQTTALMCAVIFILALSACSLRVVQTEPVSPQVMEEVLETYAPPPPQTEPNPQTEPDPPPVTDPEPQPPTPALTPEQQITIRAQDILNTMTPEQKLGQMFFVRCPAENAAHVMADYQFGGYLLFLRDFKDAAGEWLTADQLEEKLASWRSVSAIAPFFGVDEEGGTVARASRNPNLFPEGKAKSPQELLALGGEEALFKDAVSKNSTLLLHGINVNFAPVADVTTNKNAFMYARSMGTDAARTAQLVETVISGMKQCLVNGEQTQIGSVLKHFPGYGSNADTHVGGATDTRPLDTFLQQDFLPFALGIEAGADAVLVCHNVVQCMDPDLPASLSPEVHRILRETLGFRGVVMTDDLLMEAAAVYDEDGSAALMAIMETLR